MDMNTKGLDPAGKPLHLFDEFGIALNGHHLCIPPVTEGMCSGAGQHRTAHIRDPLKLSDCRGKVPLCLRHGATDPGHDLHRGLHELIVDPGRYAALTRTDQRRDDLARVLAQQLAARIDELQLPLDAQRRPGRRVPPDSHRRPPWVIARMQCDVSRGRVRVHTSAKGPLQYTLGGRYTPHTSRSASHTSPTVALARSASRSG